MASCSAIDDGSIGWNGGALIYTCELSANHDGDHNWISDGTEI